jgi:hypothetical protein
MLTPEPTVAVAAVAPMLTLAPATSLEGHLASGVSVFMVT